MSALPPPKTQHARACLPLRIFEHKASYFQSMKFLSDNGLRPLTYQEALSSYSELITRLEGKWFYLDGQGISKEGIRTFNSEGEIGELKGEGPIDQKVEVLPGNQPLSLGVDTDEYAIKDGRRFYLYGNFSPVDVAPVVVGVPTSETIAKSIIAEGRTALERLRRITEPA